jgi:hypothetical protein
MQQVLAIFCDVDIFATGLILYSFFAYCVAIPKTWLKLKTNLDQPIEAILAICMYILAVYSYENRA